jgi:hypothetical protein
MGLIERYKKWGEDIISEEKQRQIDRICKGLGGIGVEARALQEGAELENVKVGSPWWGRPTGSFREVVEIGGQPIKWVHLTGYYTEAGEVVYHYFYIIDDSEIQDKLCWDVKSTRVRSMPLVGRTLAVRWEGQLHSNIIERMNEDSLLNHLMVKCGVDARISIHWKEDRGHVVGGYWIIAPKKSTVGLHLPSAEEWDCYAMIARYLLEPSEKKSLPRIKPSISKKPICAHCGKPIIGLPFGLEKNGEVVYYCFRCKTKVT